MHDRYDEEDEDEKERIGRIFFDERESPRDQYREGYPNATEPEIKMLLAAEKKNGGTPPSSLDHAKIILSDNVWIFKPRRDSPIGRKRATCEYRPTRPDHWLAARAVHEEHRAREAAAAYREHMAKLLGPFRAKMLALARTLQMIAGKDLMDDSEMMARAVDLEKRVWKPAAKDFDDAALAVQAARRELKALEAIKLVLTESELPPGYHESPPLAPL